MNRDSSTSYSPASNQSEEPAEEARLNVVDSRVANLHAEQNNLSQASFGLTDALHRLQHLRNSLAELTDRLPAHNSYIHGSNQDVGPPHAAIVLSDATTEESNAIPDMARLRLTIPSAIMERLEEYEADSRRHSESTGRGFSSGILRTAISRQSSNNLLPSSPTQTTASRTRPTYRAPPFPDLVLPARRSWLEASLSRHRDTNPDDGSTVLGRRVAARAAAGGGSPSENPIPQLDQIFLSRTTEIARDLETAVNRLASHRAARLEQRANFNEALRNTGTRAQANDGRVSSSPGVPTNSTRTWRFGQITVGTGLQSSGPSELAAPTLSNPDLSTATPTIGPRAQRLPRDERDRPLSATPAAEQASEADNRSYLIRRGLNADGDEQVHNINLMDSDDDDPMEWLMPPMTLHAQDHPDSAVAASRVSRNISPFSSSSYYGLQGPPRGLGLSPGADQPIDDASTASEAPRRRRGRARLDADGNEVTTEVEDEIERAHARSRVRALTQVRASATPTLSPVELGAARRETLVPMTRTSINHARNDDEGVTARVRINPPRQMVISPFPLTADAIRVDDISLETPALAHSRPPINSSRNSFDTFVVDPLPMPLVDMTPCLPILRKPYPRTVNVHKYANLAGR